MENIKFFNFLEVIKHFIEIIKKRFLNIILLLLAKIIIVYLFVILFKDNILATIHAFQSERILLLDPLAILARNNLLFSTFILTLILLFINATLASVIMDYTLNKNMNMKERLKYALKNFWPFIKGHIFTIILFLLVYSITAILIAVPFMIFASISFYTGGIRHIPPAIFFGALVVSFTFFFSFFIYTPYTCLIKGSSSYLFEDTYDYIKNHKLGSILFIIIHFISSLLLYGKLLNILVSNQTNIEKLIYIIFIQTLIVIIEMVKISYIAKAIAEYHSVDHIPDILKVKELNKSCAE